MHPIERLRYVARAGGLDLVELVQDAALALGGFSEDPAALVTACRSLVDRHPAAGPVWWLASRVLTSTDPGAEAWRVVEEIEADETARTLSREVPDGACVLVIGWSVDVAKSMRRRGDCRLLVVDTAGSFPLDPRLRRGLDVEEVPESGVGAAAAVVDLVLVEAQAMGGTPGGPARREVHPGLVAVTGSRAAAAVATAAGTPVWALAPFGRVLPARLWGVLAAGVADVPQPWYEPDELVPLELVSAVVRPAGLLSCTEATDDPDCAFAPELVRPLDAPGSHR